MLALVSNCGLRPEGGGSDTPAQPCSIPEAVLRPQCAAGAAAAARAAAAAAGGSRAASLRQTLMLLGRPSQCPCPHPTSRASCTWVTPCLSHCRCVTKDLKLPFCSITMRYLAAGRLEACAAALARTAALQYSRCSYLPPWESCSCTLDFNLLCLESATAAAVQHNGYGCQQPSITSHTLGPVAVLGLTVQDVMARYARMAGKKTLWLPGTDHAGIATQVHTLSPPLPAVLSQQQRRQGRCHHFSSWGNQACSSSTWQPSPTSVITSARAPANPTPPLTPLVDVVVVVVAYTPLVEP